VEADVAVQRVGLSVAKAAREALAAHAVETAVCRNAAQCFAADRFVDRALDPFPDLDADVPPALQADFARAEFVLAEAAQNDGALTPRAVGNCSAGFGGRVAAPFDEDIDRRSIDADKPARVREPEPTGDPNDPNRFAAEPNCFPSDRSNAAAHPSANRGNT
jgi:hypothetical protein